MDIAALIKKKLAMFPYFSCKEGKSCGAVSIF